MIIYILFLGMLFALLILDKVSLRHYRLVKNSSRFIESLETVDVQELSSGGIFLWLATSLAFFFTAFRFNIGWDYLAYYQTIENNRSTNIVNNGELFNNVLVDLSRWLNMTNLYFFISTAIIFGLIFYTVFKYSRDHWLSIIFFFTFPLFYLNSLSVIRTFMALAVTVYAFQFLVKRRFLPYLLLVVLASFFHRSSLIALIFYPAVLIDITIPRMVFLLATTPLASLLMTVVIHQFFPRYIVYLNDTSNREGTKAIFVFVILGVISLSIRDRIIEDDPVARLAFNLFFIGLCIYLFFFQQGTLGHRLSLYGTIYSLLLIPKIVSLFPSEKDVLILNILIYSACILMFLYTIYVSAAAYIPYQMIWS